MRTRRITAALVASVLLLGTAAGCASDDGDDNADSGTDTEETDASNDNESNDSGDSGDADSGDTDLGDVDDLGDLGDDLEDLSGLGGDCFEFAIAYSGLYLSIFGAIDEDAAAELEGQLDELQGSVPDEVQDDWDTVRAAIEDWAAAIEEHGMLSDEAAEAGEALDTGDVAEANDNIEAYLEAECS